MAKIYTKREDIARILNLGNYPVLSIDMTNGFDDEGNVRFTEGSKCRCLAEGKHGVLPLRGSITVKADSRDNLIFRILNEPCVMSEKYPVSDFISDVEWASSPIVKPGETVAIALYCNTKIGSWRTVYLCRVQDVKPQISGMFSIGIELIPDEEEIEI